MKPVTVIVGFVGGRNAEWEANAVPHQTKNGFFLEMTTPGGATIYLNPNEVQSLEIIP